MTIPPPHPDDSFAAALDELRTALDADDMDRAILALQAVIASSFAMIAQQVDQSQLATGAQLEAIKDRLDQVLPPSPLARLEQRVATAQDLHDLAGKVQHMMEATVLMRENQYAITVLHGLVSDLENRLDEMIARIEPLERAVGDKERPQ